MNTKKRINKQIRIYIIYKHIYIYTPDLHCCTRCRKGSIRTVPSSLVVITTFLCTRILLSFPQPAALKTARVMKTLKPEIPFVEPFQNRRSPRTGYALEAWAWVAGK